MRCDTGEDGDFNWPRRLHRVFDLLKDSGADIICLQEVLPNQRRDVEQNLAAYQWYGRGRNFGGGGEQCAVGVAPRLRVLDQDTLWLCDNPRLEGTVGWDACLPRICTWVELEKPGVVIANTHFDHLGLLARRRSAELLVSTFGDKATVLLGDFNAEPTSEPLKILSHSFRDVLDLSEQPTYHEFGTLRNGPRIDYIMVSKEIEIAWAEIVPESRPYCSDHFALRAELVVSQ